MSAKQVILHDAERGLDVAHVAANIIGVEWFDWENAQNVVGVRSVVEGDKLFFVFAAFFAITFSAVGGGIGRHGRGWRCGVSWSRGVAWRGGIGGRGRFCWRWGFGWFFGR